MADDATAPEQSDLAAQATEWVVAKVDLIKTRTTDNAVLVLRGLVFGLVISVLAVAAVLMTVIMLVRIADAYLPIGAGVGDATWAAHGFIGVLFSVLGLGAWLSRKGEGTPKPLLVALVLDLIFVTVIVCYGLFS